MRNDWCSFLRSISVAIFLVAMGFGERAVAAANSQPDSKQLEQADFSPLPDDRYKADILVVIAHPDDETLISGYLAKAVLDEGKRVDVVFTTRGNAGDNEVGYEQAAALADMREIEARQALASIGITNVCFSTRPTPPRVMSIMCCDPWKRRIMEPSSRRSSASYA